MSKDVGSEKNGMIWKILLASAGILITVGGICATIRYNTQRLEKVEVKASANENDIRELKTDIKYIRSGVDEIKREVKQ